MAILIAVFLPLVSYVLVKRASDHAIVMPRRYFYDSVSTRIQDGKRMEDTIWHSVFPIALTNQLGAHVSLGQLKGKAIVLDFFFTHCPSICPTLTRNMKQIQDALKSEESVKRADSSFLQFVSFTVDPERDSAAVLKKYGDRFGVNPDLWWLLTSPKKAIYDFALDELKLGLVDGEGVDSNFIHTQKIVLLDKERVVRGYYDGLDSMGLMNLARDIGLIMLEKDRHAKPEILSEMIAIWPIFLFVIIAVALFMVFNRKPAF